MLRNLTRALAGLGLAGLPLVAAAQEKKQDPVSWMEVRFHRVHLKNGNFIDGALVSKSPKSVVLNMKSGDFAIRADMIQRVEYMKVRSLHEAPKTVAFQKEAVAEGPPVVGAAPKKEGPAAAVLETTDPGALKDLVSSLEADPFDKRRVKLLDLMEKKGSEGPAYLASLMERVTEEPRSQIADVLIEKNASAAIPVLLKLLRSTSAHVREQSLRAIAGVGSSDTVSQIEFCLADSAPAVRAAALMVYLRQGEADDLERVGGMLRDADPSVRGTALAALQSLANRHKVKEKFAEILLNEIRNAPAETASSMVTAIGKLKDATLAPQLASLAESEEPLVRATAIPALVDSEPTMAAKVIMDRFEVETEYAPRVQLAEGAKKLRLKPAVPTLIGWIEDENVQIQSAASTALRGITGQNFGNDAERWNAWWETAKPR